MPRLPRACSSTTSPSSAWSPIGSKPRAEALLGELPAGTIPVQPPGSKMYVKCPVCATMMNRKLFAAGAGVIIDVCRAHGACFDLGELPRVIEFVMSGGLEKAEKKEIARLRDAAKREQQSAQVAQLMTLRAASHHYAGQPSNASAFVDLLFSLFG